MKNDIRGRELPCEHGTYASWWLINLEAHKEANLAHLDLTRPVTPFSSIVGKQGRPPFKTKPNMPIYPTLCPIRGHRRSGTYIRMSPKEFLWPKREQNGQQLRACILGRFWMSAQKVRNAWDYEQRPLWYEGNTLKNSEKDAHVKRIFTKGSPRVTPI